VLKIYAHCIDGQADAANQRIDEALSEASLRHVLVKDGGDDGEQAL
jgi:ribosome maturation protein Sdo1